MIRPSSVEKLVIAVACDKSVSQRSIVRGGPMLCGMLVSGYVMMNGQNLQVGGVDFSPLPKPLESDFGHQRNLVAEGLSVSRP